MWKFESCAFAFDGLSSLLHSRRCPSRDSWLIVRLDARLRRNRFHRQATKRLGEMTDIFSLLILTYFKKNCQLYST